MSSVWLVCRLRRSDLLLPLLTSLLISGMAMMVPRMLGAQMGTSYPVANSAGGASSSSTVIPSTVLGKVINATTGAPVPRALVRLNNRAVLTDHEGKFRFDQNTASSANILVTKPGFSATTEMQEGGNLYLQGAQLGVPLELRLYPEALLTGTVLGPDGAPLPRILVSAMRSFYDETGHRWVTVGQDQTDSHGNFRLPEPAGEYRLETRYTPMDRTTGEAVLPVSVPAEGSSSTSQVIKAHAGEELHFELRPAVSPTHTVTTSVGQSSSGREFMRISARSSSGSSLQLNAQMAGEPGEVKIQLPQGSYTLTARRGNPESPEQAETTVTVPDHDLSGVVLQFAPVPSIPVELIVDGSSDNKDQPPTVPQLGLALQSDQPDPERGDSGLRPTVHRDQSFVFTAPPGSYRLQSRSMGVWYIKSASYGDADLLQHELVVVPGAAGTAIRLVVSNQTGSLQGTVSLSGSAGACWVYLIPTGANTAQPVIALRSNSSGSYTTAHLPPGSYQAIAFERRHSANYRDPASLAPYSTYVHSVTVNAGDKPTLNLDAVPVAEVVP